MNREYLSGRSTLIATTNGLERSLDQLKITLGLPTDLPIDINLRELDQLTLLDEIAVAVERVRRWRRRVEEQLASQATAATRPGERRHLYDRTHRRNGPNSSERHDGQVPDLSEIEELDSRLRLEQSHYEVERNSGTVRRRDGGRCQRTHDSGLPASDRVAGGEAASGRPSADEPARSWHRCSRNCWPKPTEIDGRRSHCCVPREQRWNRIRRTTNWTPWWTRYVPSLDQMTQLAMRLDRLLQYEPDRAESIRDEQALADTKRLLEVVERDYRSGRRGTAGH